MLWGVDVETNNISGFGFKLGIIRGHIALQTMGAEAGAFPDPGHHHVTDTQLLGQFAGSPVGRSIRRRLAGPSQNAGLQLRRLFFNGPARMPGIESGESLFDKPLLPAADVTAVATQSLSNLRVRIASGQPQDQPGAPDVF